MSVKNIGLYLKKAKVGIDSYLKKAKADGKIDSQQYTIATQKTYPNLEKWLKDSFIDKFSSNLKQGIYNKIDDECWEDLVNAFRQDVRFGTGGIRAMMSFDKESIELMKEKGLNVPILKGPNTINEIVLLKTSVGVAQYGKKNGLSKIVIGYDSRIQGFNLARIVAELFLAYDYTVFFFDAPCPYPEITFAIPDEVIKADIGILISASHNDYRYNGYKLSCSNGSQFDPVQRNTMYNEYIVKASTADIRLRTFAQASEKQLFFLGGDKPVEKFPYAGKEANLINIHKRHRNHVQSFMIDKDIAKKVKDPLQSLHIGYCAFHGAGNNAVPRILKEVGFKDIKVVTKNGLNDCDGMFPSFRNTAGQEQQPDPGDPRAARIAVNAYKDDHPGTFDDLDILIGTDPDADRCGVVVKVPRDQQFIYDDQDWTLIPADELWALIVWYRLEMGSSKTDNKKKFITLSHTTSDVLTKLALKYDVGVVKTWVGFGSLAAATQEIWDGNYKDLITLIDGRNDKYPVLCHPNVCACHSINDMRSFNIAAMEQSNGFSILGGPPPDAHSLGVNGHVRDKDGTFAAILTAEIAAWAKSKNTTIMELLDKNIYLDPKIGLFVTGYEPDPTDGEYPGIEGDRLKKSILRRALGYLNNARAGNLTIAGLKVKSAIMYRTGKYDAIYPQTPDFSFPDEGIRFFFDDEKMNHVTVRPSGTGNSLRFHTQLHEMISGRNEPERKEMLLKKKYDLRNKSNELFNDLRKLLKAPKGK